MSDRNSTGSGGQSEGGDESAATLVPVINDLRTRLAGADGLLFLTDFDGTLAPIVDDPDAAIPLSGVTEALQSIRNGEDAAVGVVSGRALSDLRDRVGVAEIGYAGNHGLELAHGGNETVHAEAADAVGAIDDIASTLTGRLEEFEGCAVEDKGVTMTVHFRRADRGDVSEIERIVRETVDERDADVAITAGKEILEIRPDVDWNKGSALEWFCDRIVPDDETWITVYIGDDVTDEDAFAAIENGVSVKVGTGETIADHRISGPHQVRALLDWVARSVTNEERNHRTEDE